MQPNPFPAILLAGPPHSGKSVLAHLLTEHLWRMGISHYLLRAVPDGEGNWFHTGKLDTVHLLRQRNKHGFRPEFVAHMRRVIEQRWLPLLVDIGGKPQDDQFDLLRACTHLVLLYREQDDYAVWRKHLDDAGLRPVAELRSQLDAPDKLTSIHPLLTGVIGGLARELDARRAALSFGALLACITGILQTEEAALERVHLPAAPLPLLLERDLARQIGILTDEGIFWKPENLPQLAQIVPAAQPYALYGRGPVWLAAMLAAHALPAPFAFFDVRYNWLETPTISAQGLTNHLNVTYSPCDRGGLWAEISIPEHGVLQPGTLMIAPPPPADGIVLSGPLPRWAFAALTRAFAPHFSWVAVDEPTQDRAIVVFSREGSLPVGSLLPRKLENPAT